MITIVLGVLVLQDRNARIDAARRQSLALATGIDRLVHYEMRNLERALAGIARNTGDATLDPMMHARRDAAVSDLLSRQEEIQAVEWFDAQGGARGGRQDDATLPTWAGRGTNAQAGLSIGPLQRRGDLWTLPVALPTPRGWLVARLGTAEFQRMIDRLDTGRDGSAAILARDGTIVAHDRRAGAHVGKRIALPATGEWADGIAGRDAVSQLDGVERAMRFSATSGYPFVVGAGIGLSEALSAWRWYAAAGGSLVLLYWLSLLYLVRRLRANERARETMLEQIETQSEWLQQAQRATKTGVWRVEAGTSTVRVSSEMAALFGLEPGDGLVPIDDFFDRIHVDDRERIRSSFAHSQMDGAPFEEDYRIVPSDGSVRWVEGRGATVRDRRGTPAMTGTVNDVSALHAAQLQLERAELQFRHLFERNPLPFWVVDIATRRFLAANDAAIDSYGYRREELLAMRDTDLLAPSVAEQESAEFDLRTGIVRHVARDGREIEVRIQARDIDFADRPARLVLAEDIGERLTYERDLAWRANHDSTTGLLTVPALILRLDTSCDAGAAPGFAVAYVRLRDLELVAPTLGQRAAEKLLREAAARFARIGAQFGWVAYAPAESFVVVALDPAHRDEMVAALVAAIDAPIELEGGLQSLEAWIGLASAPCEAGGAEKVVGHAALAALKARRDNLPLLAYDATMAAVAADRLALLRRVRRAVELSEFELFFQPIRQVPGGKPTALEALLRWRQPDGSFVPPLQFIPLCEESGLIVPIGAWVLEQAARAHQRLAAAGHGDVAIAVNVSAVQFDAGTTADVLRRLQRDYALPENALHLELTESVVLRNPDAARAQMRRLREQGVCLSIDDFGTGFSSMAYLRDLPLDHLKIDRAFVHDVDRDARNASICRALIALGHGLGLRVIAEGVERDGQLAWLHANACDQAQGYHLGRPAPLDEALAALLT
ncbi:MULTISPECIES: bifunctional diguanylate cyclase/phosphodiesterase [Luteimonas]|uniref:bifunctional diguanylate cyclase/phosphodiesterase n=1 Tax=Luteimonas TaxID=83614 RepID=UPI0013040BB6|nr:MULTISPECIES: EAL domain-containing protein [Luteimonas]